MLHFHVQAEETGNIEPETLAEYDELIQQTAERLRALSDETALDVEAMEKYSLPLPDEGIPLSMRMHKSRSAAETDKVDRTQS